MNINRVLRNPSIPYYSVIIAVFLLAEIIFYQFYYSVPIIVNNQQLQAKRGETLEQFLQRKKLMPQWGKLLDIDNKMIPDKKGNPPHVIVNGQTSGLSHALEANDEIIAQKGADEVEDIVGFKSQEVQSKVVYRGKGAFISVIKRGRPGVRMIGQGQISKKPYYGKWLVSPQDFTVGKFNIRYRKVVALTFDDGPSKYTSLIMKILKENKAKASFFVVGYLVKKRTKLLKEMARRRYTIGNHTYNHISLSKSSPQLIKKQLKMTEKEIYDATGKKPTWVRPPGGELNSSAINLILKQKYHISLWNIDTVDWRRKRASVIRNKILDDLKPGQVILLHDGGGNRMNTAKALPEIIKGIKEAGYRLVSLDDLYRLVE